MNAPVPQRIKMMEVEQLWQRIIALESANGKCGEAIAAAVAAEREACWKIALDIATKQYDNEQAVQIYDAIRARNGNGGKGE